MPLPCLHIQDHIIHSFASSLFVFSRTRSVSSRHLFAYRTTTLLRSPAYWLGRCFPIWICCIVLPLWDLAAIAHIVQTHCFCSYIVCRRSCVRSIWFRSIHSMWLCSLPYEAMHFLVMIIIIVRPPPRFCVLWRSPPSPSSSSYAFVFLGSPYCPFSPAFVYCFSI